MLTTKRLISYATKNLYEGKPSSYLLIYEEYFARMINKEVKLLELGVAKGGSLLMWRDYFPKATIVGLDLNATELNEPRIHTYQGRQDDTALLTRIAEEHAPGGFDIIIDDCSHIGELAKISFWHLFEHHLKPGGIYAIEDWGTGYWSGHIYYPDGHTYRLGEKETVMHWLANKMLKHSPQECPHLSLLQRLFRHHKYTRRFKGHNFGMVGFVKQLVDECGMADITNPDYAFAHPQTTPKPQIPSRISKMLVVPGLVVVSKVSDLLEPKNDPTTALQIVQPEGRDFRMLTDSTHVSYYEQNNLEEYSADLVLQRCKDGGTFIDIGAHHGYYTLLVATQRKHCNVFAFEPDSDNYQILKENLRLNNTLGVVTFNYAVSESNGISDFQVRDFSSHGSLYNDHISTTVKTVTVSTVSLDTLLRSSPGVPIVVKIDTEGHEINVLKGMKNLLTNIEEIAVLVEFNPIILGKANQQPEELLQLIASFGFNVYFVDDERRQTYQVTEDHFNEWEQYLQDGNFQRGYCNILCLK